MSSTPAENKPQTVTDRARVIVDSILTPLGAWLHRLGIHPDTVTMLGTALVGVAAALIAMGRLQLGALLLLVALPLDAVDGAVARAMRRKDRFGAMLDSTLDRYADGFIFVALGYYFAVQGRLDMLLLAQAALLGSLLVSYSRARAEGIGVATKIGLFTRLERVVMILVMLFIPALLDWGILLLAIGTNATTLQRLWFVYRTVSDHKG